MKFPLTMLVLAIRFAAKLCKYTKIA